MEHFIVKFDSTDIRDVLLDGNRIGSTETVLLADTNDYTVTLGGRPNYIPASKDVVISGTTPETPLVIVFTKTA